jgi:predicted nuclease with TOPRIM domain
MQVLKLKNLYEELEEKLEGTQKENKRLQGD